MKKFVIADPSLIDNRGHHFSLTQKVSNTVSKMGFETIWLTNERFERELVSDDCTICPTFSLCMYDMYKADKNTDHIESCSALLKTELLNIVRELELTGADFLYFHTGFTDIYVAVEHLLQSYPLDMLPSIHICTPYEPKSMPGWGGKNEINMIIDGLLKAPSYETKLFLWCETLTLASYYTLTFERNVGALPLSFIPMEDSIQTSPESPLTILYLGAAREEKGFTLLPDIIEQLYEGFGQAGLLKFVIQCTPQIVGYLPIIQSAISKLEKYPKEYVNLIRHNLSNDEYHSELESSDVVLLLYNKTNYKLRGSGIAVEAISGSKIILTHKDTFCASLITHGGGVAVDDKDGAVDAIKDILKEKAAYKSKAARQSEHYKKYNSMENYVRRIVLRGSPQTSPKFMPNAIIGKCVKQLL
ncbi:glycosyltransferase [Thalassotalea euphylliae]|uniref:Glycosyltransferase family 1 protein n=1 Tax=Thalassotalea euphylliae TaxID=1655234 RepID=A0A3E0U0T8_9GAMM|nr:glycosyltransferase [Thalassotalea euphylliae]REL30193.1 glycosyltransferase family 1 protein [Thalassotalea euphylliae]